MIVTILAFGLAANCALAQLPGPFNFSFAAPFLNAIFLWPLGLGGCL